jgi:hypothetical protein
MSTYTEAYNYSKNFIYHLVLVHGLTPREAAKCLYETMGYNIDKIK